MRDDSLGSDGVANAFAKEAEAQGIQVVAREGYSDGDKDFKAQLTKNSSTKSRCSICTRLL